MVEGLVVQIGARRKGQQIGDVRVWGVGAIGKLVGSLVCNAAAACEEKGDCRRDSGGATGRRSTHSDWLETTLLQTVGDFGFHVCDARVHSHVPWHVVLRGRESENDD